MHVPVVKLHLLLVHDLAIIGRDTSPLCLILFQIFSQAYVV